MCDLYSWGVMKLDIPEKNLKAGDIIFLTDADIEAKFDATLLEEVQDYIGHRALARYYGISEDSFEPNESITRIPVALAKEVAAGHCKRMIAAVGEKPRSYTIPIGSDLLECEMELWDIDCAFPIRPDYLRRILKKLREITFALDGYSRAKKRVIWAALKNVIVSGADPFGQGQLRNIRGLVDVCIQWDTAPCGPRPYEEIHNLFTKAVNHRDL